MADQLTDEQKEEFKIAFKVFDKDEDGQLNSKEIVMALKSLGVSVPESDVGSSLDLNGFYQIVSKKLQILDAEEDLKRALLCFDQDGSGAVSSEYLKYILTSIGDVLTPQEVDQMISECDTDRDGRISSSDAAKVLLKYA